MQHNFEEWHTSTKSKDIEAPRRKQRGMRARNSISAMLKLGNSLKNIGLALGKGQSVISREVSR